MLSICRSVLSTISIYSHMHTTPQREIFQNSRGIDAQTSSTATSHFYAVDANWIVCCSVNCPNLVAQFSILRNVDLCSNIMLGLPQPGIPRAEWPAANKK
jgi:hypothetical protein